VRFGLSGEAGLNDGIAFPFVILGLLFLQQNGSFGSGLDDWFLGFGEQRNRKCT
jgi:NhaP-type Na+/H+ or K+/H+ antiporter